MTDTIHLGLPFIEGGQAQKHVTHNEALLVLDAVIQLSVLDRTRVVPPGMPDEGARHIVGADATGSWAGWDGSVALYYDAHWQKISPRDGWLAWDAGAEELIRFKDGAWELAGTAGAPGEVGEAGPPGQGIQPDAVVDSLADRDAYDDADGPFCILVTADDSNEDRPTFYFKLSATSGDWSAPVTFSAGGEAGPLDASELQEIELLGVGTEADATNPLSAKLNNVLWAARTVAEGGDGTLRYKLSKESAEKTLSLLFQDDFSGRAEIGLTGDDDFHFKTSSDGTTWIDALLFDAATGSAKINTGFFLTGGLSPAQITANQNDYNPAGLSGASVLRLSSDASRNMTGLSGGGDGRVLAILNAGTQSIVLKDANASSSAGNRFSFGADVTLAGKQSVLLWYDATDARWKLLAGPQSAGGGSGTVTSVATATGLSGGPITGSGTIALDIPALSEDTAPDIGADYWLTYDSSAGAHKKAKGTNFARERLAANRTYYVRTDGSDSNSGLADNSGGAFLTIQKAVNVVANAVDLAGYDITIQVAAGTYSGAVTVGASWVGAGMVTLQGDNTTPSNVVLGTTGTSALTVQNGGSLCVSGMKLTTSGSGSCVTVSAGGHLVLSGSMDFGASSGNHFNAAQRSQVTINSNYTISGGATRHLSATQNSVIQTPGRTVTVSANITFGVAFAQAQLGSGINITGWSASLGGNTVTGKRYDVASCGQINTNGGGASYLPGDTSGSSATGGQYF